MKNCMRVFIEKIFILCLLAVVSFALSSCGYMGPVVSADKRVLFSEHTNSQGNFSDGDLTINYNYSLTGGKLHLAGDIAYRGSVDSLDVRLLFLDPTGSVMQQKIIYSSGYRVYTDWGVDRNFQAHLVVPPGATGISFSYIARPRNHQI